MRRFVLLVAALAAMATGSVANAADNMWFTLVSSNGDAVAIEQGPGSALVIEKLPSTTTLRIAMNFTASDNLTGNDAVGMSSYSFALNSTAGFFSNGAIGDVTNYNAPAGGADGDGSFGFQNLSAAVNGSDGVGYLFDLTINDATLGLVANVTGDFPSNMIYGINHSFPGARWYGFVGGNPISYGSPSYTGGLDVTPGWGSLPVISVINVPEPASMALLAMGAVALIRRRR